MTHTGAIPDGSTVRVQLKGGELLVAHDEPQAAASTAA